MTEKDLKSETLSIIDYRSAADNVLYEEIYRRAKLANQTLVINPPEMLPVPTLTLFHPISPGVLVTTTSVLPNQLPQFGNPGSDLSNPRIATRIRQVLLDSSKEYINRLDHVISYSFTYQDQTLFVILYTDKLNRLSQFLKDWPPENLKIENHSVKFLPKDCELLPEFGRTVKDSRISGCRSRTSPSGLTDPDHDSIWPGIARGPKPTFSTTS